MTNPDSSEVSIVASQDPALRVVPRLLPDALALAVSLLIVWQAFRPGELDEKSMNWVMTILAGELFTFLFVVGLVEVASDWKEPPTLWGGLLVIAILLVTCGPTVFMLAKWSWHAGVWVFLPFAWSMAERFRQLWTLPRASPLEKLRTRALAIDRFHTCFVGYMGMFLTLVVVMMASDDGDAPGRVADWLMPSFLALFFAIACINEIRVYTEGFARSPRRLWARPGRPDPWFAEEKPKNPKADRRQRARSGNLTRKGNSS